MFDNVNFLAKSSDTFVLYFVGSIGIVAKIKVQYRGNFCLNMYGISDFIQRNLIKFSVVPSNLTKNVHNLYTTNIFIFHFLQISAL